MKTAKAKTVKKQIDKYYVSGHISYADLFEHLKNNKIDNGVQAEENHSGYSHSDNSSIPAIIKYADNSVLLITGYSVEAAIII